MLHVLYRMFRPSQVLLLRQRLSEYEAPPPHVREHSLHEPQASHSESRSSSERAVLELRRREARSKVPAAAQRQPSMVGWCGTVVGPCVSCEALCCPLTHPAPVRKFSPASPPPSAPLTFPEPERWVGWGRLQGSAAGAGEQPMPLLLIRHAAQQSRGV